MLRFWYHFSLYYCTLFFEIKSSLKFKVKVLVILGYNSLKMFFTCLSNKGSCELSFGDYAEFMSL